MAQRPFFLLAVVLLLLVGCDGDPSTDAGADAAPALECADDAECDDGLFCNGTERCAPGAAGADADGCVAGLDPCASDEVCSESGDACVDQCPDADGDGHAELSCGGDDCDDEDEARFPGNPETCDAEGHDEDCDPNTLGADRDGDGYVSVGCCNLQADGSNRCGRDCDDSGSEVNPDATEVCNGIDEDCDAAIDEGVQTTYYQDDDGDGAGDPDLLVAVEACSQPSGYSDRATDCDDTDPMRRVGLAEVCDGRDNDCDDELDAPDEDDDGDGFADDCAGLAPALTDCDDEQPTTYPGAPELCNGVDDDCSGAPIEGDDLDGDGQVAVGSSCVGDALPRTDCDDAVPTTYAGALEVCNGVDDDCDGSVDGSDAFCGLEHATSTCADALCAIATCEEGYLDCDDDPTTGCEIDRTADEDHCGACGAACTAAEYCRAASCTEYVQWATALGGTPLEVRAHGAHGAVYAGRFRDAELTVGATTLTNAGPCDTTCDDDILVAALSDDGAPSWARSFGGTGSEEVRAVAIDAAGDVVLVGPFTSGDLEIVEGDALHSSRGVWDIFVTKLDGATGAPRWAVSFGGTRAEIPLAVAVDDAGDLVVAGIFESPTLAFEGRVLVASDSYDLFVVKLRGTDGSVVWAKAFGTVGNDAFGGMTLAAGDVLLAGAFEGETLPVGSTTLTGTECFDIGGTRYCPDDIFAARLAAVDGSTVWARTYPGGREETLVTLAPDPTGGAIMAGRMYGTLGGETFDEERFVARIAATDGSVSWARALDGSANYYIRDVAADATGRVWVTGLFDGATFPAAGQTFDSAGERDVLLVRLAADGSEDWASTFGAEGGDEGMSLDVGADGRLRLLGSSYSSTLRVGTFDVPQGGSVVDPGHFAASISVE